MLKKSLTQYVKAACPRLSGEKQARLVLALMRMAKGWGESSPDHRAEYVDRAVEKIAIQFGSAPSEIIVNWLVSNQSRTTETIRDEAENHSRLLAHKLLELFSDRVRLLPEADVTAVEAAQGSHGYVEIRTRIRGRHLTEPMLRRAHARLAKAHKKLGLARTGYVLS